MTIAAVMTVRNEEQLLRSNLLYHHFLGVDHFFIYVDRCEDGTVASISDLPFVQMTPMPPTEALTADDDAGRLLAHIRSAPNRHGLRLTANAFHAMREARRRGWDWLLHIDADELVCIDPQNPAPGQLREHLDRVDPKVEIVRFRPFEVCQRRLGYENVFAEETLFKSPEFTQGNLIARIRGRLTRVGRRCLGLGEQVDPRLGRLYRTHRRRDVIRTTRQVFDPCLGRMVNVSWFYGHRQGKVAARLSADVIPKTVHDFERRTGRRPREERKDHLLHYFAYSFENLVARARVRPNFYGPFQVFKSIFIDAVNQSGLSMDELKDFYQQWVLFGDDEIEEFRRNHQSQDPTKPKIVEITGPQRTFAMLNGHDANASRASCRAA